MIIKRNNYICEWAGDDTTITEPDQAFTPREIVEQFARGELTAKMFNPSDAFACLLSHTSEVLYPTLLVLIQNHHHIQQY